MLKKKKVAKPSNPHKARLDKMRKKYEETAGDDRWAKFKEGKTYIRILPPWGPSADGSFFLAGALHYQFKIGGRPRAIPCPQFSGRGNCPICSFVDKLKNSGDDDFKKLAGDLRMRKKYWFNIILRDKDGKPIPDAKIKMYGANQKFLDSIMEAMDDPDTGDISDPVEGHDVVVKRVGMTMNDTRYSVTVRPRASAIARDGWEKDMFQLDEVVMEWMSEKEMLDALAKNYGDEAADLGFKLLSGKKAKKKVKDEEDDDEDDEDDDSDDDSRTSRKRSSSKKKRSRDEDDEEEDEEDEDEDEDEDEED